jgi:hypothetical protein
VRKILHTLAFFVLLKPNIEGEEVALIGVVFWRGKHAKSGDFLTFLPVAGGVAAAYFGRHEGWWHAGERHVAPRDAETPAFFSGNSSGMKASR